MLFQSVRGHHPLPGIDHAVAAPAELAWYVTGRFYGKPDGSLADYGYFLHLAGIDAALFNGAPGEATAHFTFAAEPFRAGKVSNGSLNLALDAIGDFPVYLQHTPLGDFAWPASFGLGERIATFRRASMVLGTTVKATGSPLMALNAFTARLIDSVSFEFAGRRHDLARIIGRGVTRFGIAAATPVVTPTQPHDVVLPFSGSAIALG